ncbi:hypothetical protein HN385_01540 [archaeon]|jgi:hypothetical protein|nr:hypothetical protein [archaeon]MBT3451691.1 hypothetical protein [archaeon]MBT6869377.1 hypothetical protein [archaeon]MBT7192540.1 hypothetical protein [archaeon]MBT7380616.1 hypothetical protein [archaeon]
MKKLFLLLTILLLASCSIVKEASTEFPIVEFEDEPTWEVDYIFVQEEVVKDIILKQDYLITNPSSDVELDMTIYYPNTNQTSYPAIISLAGGLGEKHGLSTVTPFLNKGIAFIAVSLDGRGESGGEEDFNGYIGQDGLYETYRLAKSLEKIDENNIGAVSFSYGVAGISGMLARYQVPLKYYIEWEGPINRNAVTKGCDLSSGAVPDVWEECSNDTFWFEREAERFIPYFNVSHFLIMQGEEDHAGGDGENSLNANNLAIQYLDWVRVNDADEINQEYTLETIPKCKLGLDYKLLAAEFASELSET